MFCPVCQAVRNQVEVLMRTPWEYILSQYEFMIVFASFQRNILFYSKMDRGQLRNMYSQLVSFSPARILVTDNLISVYEKRQLDGKGARDSFDVPCDLSEVITLTIGNHVPEKFVRECMSSCNWKGYDDMVLASFASAESVRSGALKYMNAVKESVRNRDSLHVIISLAITGWMVKLSDSGGSECSCGIWPQALDLVSCFVSDAETTLTIQDEARVSAYIRTLLDLSAPQSKEASPCHANRRPLDYEYLFSDLLVTGLDSAVEGVTTHH